MGALLGSSRLGSKNLISSAFYSRWLASLVGGGVPAGVVRAVGFGGMLAVLNILARVANCSGVKPGPGGCGLLPEPSSFILRAMSSVRSDGVGVDSM